MKRLLGAVALSLLVGVVAVMSGVPAKAATKESSTQRIEKDQVHSGLYVRAASTVRIDGVVNGDVIVAAEDFVLNGTVNGSIYIAAGKARIDGVVSGNMHVAAGSVEMNGSAGSAYVAASDITFGKDAKLSGSLLSASSEANIGGQVGQGVYIAASTADLNAKVGASARIEASSIKVGKDAAIAGDLRYSQGAQIDIANDQNIEGAITQVGQPKKPKNDLVDRASGVLFGLISSFILGLVMLFLAPKSVIATADYVKQKPAQTLLAGFGFLVIAPVALVMTLVTLVGIPLAVIGFMIYVVLLIIAHIFVALLVGRWVIKGDDKKRHTPTANLLPLLVGLTLTGVIELLPILGGMVSFLVLIAGLGAVVARTWQRLNHIGGLQRAL